MFRPRLFSFLMQPYELTFRTALVTPGVNASRQNTAQLPTAEPRTRRGVVAQKTSLASDGQVANHARHSPMQIVNGGFLQREVIRIL
jgi:hypothetical protein